MFGYLEESFLNLMNTIRHRKFDRKLFDKRDSFPFLIEYMSYRKSSISFTSFYSAFGTEILR